LSIVSEAAAVYSLRGALRSNAQAKAKSKENAVRKIASICLLTAAAASLLLADEGAGTRRDVLGVQLTMNDAAVRKRLSEIGSLARKERKRQEVWTVRDDAFSHVVIGFEKTGELHYVTAVARSDKEAKRIRYEEIGPLSAAQQQGDAAINNFNYVWTLPEEEGRPAMQVIARGRDPAFLDTYSLKRSKTEAAGETEDDD